MGLFEFLKNTGSKVLTKKNAKAVRTPEIEKLEADLLNKQKMLLLDGIIQGMGIKVKHLELDFDGSTVTIWGEVKKQEEREKIILAMGNVSGVAAVDDRLSVVKPAPEAIMHTVKRGESLSKIAKHYYGDVKKYKKIFEANQPMLKDPNKIFPGQVLRIPDATTTA